MNETPVFEGFNMDEFKPVCKRCGRRVEWGQELGESTGVGGIYHYHANPHYCGIVSDWAKPADHKIEG